MAYGTQLSGICRPPTGTQSSLGGKRSCPVHSVAKGLPMSEGNAASGTAASGEPGEDDAALITRSLADPEEFAALFHRHAPVIQRYVTRRIGAHAADDVVAETFLVAF